MKKLTWTTIVGFGLSLLGLVLIIYFAFSKAFNDGSGNLNANLASNFGSFVGGIIGPIFSLAGFVLLYETIVAQRSSFDAQQNAFQIQQFETKFFELIKFHRDNVAQMVHRVPGEKDKIYDGARVFIEINSQFQKIYKITREFVNSSQLVSDEYKENAAINIAYLILFFGVSKRARPDLEHFFAKYGYDKSLTDSIVNELYKKKAEYNPNVVYYGGHQVRLGHYFRHLFQTVKFVDKAAFLEPMQKYDYVKTLRAQLTQHELAIFFLNSLSIGEEWNNKNYMVNYKMIKNLPQYFIDGIKPKKYYSKIKFEWER
jgi:hypothetical protein